MQNTKEVIDVVNYSYILNYISPRLSSFIINKISCFLIFVTADKNYWINPSMREDAAVTILEYYPGLIENTFKMNYHPELPRNVILLLNSSTNINIFKRVIIIAFIITYFNRLMTTQQNDVSKIFSYDAIYVLILK